MKRGRRSAADRAGERLLDLWERRPEDGEPIGCVATTYTFDPAHFEEHCLARFVGLQSDPAEDARSYLIEREEQLSQIFAGVLVDQAHVSATRSLRWHLLPVRVEHGGCLHAKISLLAWEQRVRLIIASANLTEPGYRHNIENAASFDFTPKGETPRGVLEDVIRFLDDIRGRAPGMDRDDGPQPALARFLRGVTARVKTWSASPVKRAEPTVTLVATGPGRESLFVQVAALWTGPRVRDAWVLSPFFDEGDGALETIAALESLMSHRNERTVHLVTSGQRLPDGIVQLDLPACLEIVAKGHAARRFYMVTNDPEVGPRPLHAKSLWLERDGRAFVCVGSSNFTRAGTGHRDYGPVNLEANVVYELPDTTDDFGRVCSRAYPASQELKPNEVDIRFLATTERTPEPTGYAPLPAAFGCALFRVCNAVAELEVELLGPPPAGVAIRTEHGLEISLPRPPPEAGSAQPQLVTTTWTEPRPASHLLVSWSAEGVDHVAIWPINAANGAALPPPEELRALTLDELVEVLVSARPAHEAIAKLYRRRAEHGSGAGRAESDPHRRIATQHFLLKRMRRMSAAFEELRTRLERPIHTREALWWRLRGPLGAVALAQRIVAEEPATAGFQLAELALTFRELKLQPRGELSRDDMRTAVDAVIKDLAAMAHVHPAPPNLASYVARTFEEVSR